MPQLDPARMALFMAIVGIAVQVLKTPLSSLEKNWLPLGAAVLGMVVGLALSLYYGLDPVGGLLEGLFGGASAVGAYEGLHSALPGVVTERGWLPTANGE